MRLAGPAARVAPALAAMALMADEQADELNFEEVRAARRKEKLPNFFFSKSFVLFQLPQKRGRTTAASQQTASILLKKMAPSKNGSSLRMGGAPAARAAAPAPASAPIAKAAARKNISVEDVVMWEKATGRQWHKLTPAEKVAETEMIRKQYN